MGVVLSEIASDNQSSNFLTTLDPVLTQQSNNFGEIKVYRRTEKPYDYYMRYREQSMESEQTHANIKYKLMLYQKLSGHRNIVHVEATRTNKSNPTIDFLCSNIIFLDSYARYHNYTLEQAIACKIANQKYFRQSDLLYVLESLLSVGQRLSSVCGDNYKGMFKNSKVYLSTQGYIKVYPFQVLNIKTSNFSISQQEQKNVRVIYHEMEVFNSALKSRIGREGEIHTKTQRDDRKDIGNMIVELSLLTKTEEYASTRKNDKQTLQSNLRDRISQGLKQIILRLVFNNEDCTFKSVLAELQTLKQQSNIRAAYCICLEEDISRSKRELMMAKQRQSFKQSQKDEQLSRQSETCQNVTPTKIRFYKNGSRVTEE